MLKKTSKRTLAALANLMCLLSLVTLAVWSCSSSGYDDPTNSTTTTQTPTALISAETLKDWMDQGLVNKQGGYDRVVILSITSRDSYDRGHIPGAIFVDNGSEIQQTRVEGLAPSVGMVIDGAKMDALIKRAGIDQYTTIVFTASSTDAVFQPARGYVTFRYWGFPKARLKVLDGWDNGWKSLYPLTGEVPVVTASNYTVTPGGVNRTRTDLRASLGEMIAAVERIDAETIAGTPSGVIIDGRSASTAGSYSGAAGATTGVFSPNATGATTDYVVFEGHMKNAVALNYKSLYSATTYTYIIESEMISKFTDTSIGMDATKTAYVHCRTGNIASALFFVLDGILGWDTVWYDGSWSQWGQMSTTAAAKGGKLPADSAWATDTATLSGLAVYNLGQLVSGVTLSTDHIEALPLDSAASTQYLTVDDSRANQIENEDASYVSPTATGGSGGSSGGGNTGC